MAGILCIIPARGGSKGIRGRTSDPSEDFLDLARHKNRGKRVCDFPTWCCPSIPVAEIGASFGAKVPFLLPRRLPMTWPP